MKQTIQEKNKALVSTPSTHYLTSVIIRRLSAFGRLIIFSTVLTSNRAAMDCSI